MTSLSAHALTSIAAALTFVLAASLPSANATELSLSLSGKPQLGATLNVEVTSDGPETVFLLVDALPGPTLVKGVSFGIGFSPAFLALPLGTVNGLTSLPAALANDPVLEGLVIYLQAAVPSPLSASNAVAVTLTSSLPMASVNDYAYQLQGPGGIDLSLSPMAASAFDLCVVDYSSDGASEFSPAQVAALKSAAEPDRVRLAYMSIGEAEDYRWYWPLISPSLVASSNPQWPGNFKVFYWEPEWKEVIIHGNAAVGQSYLDRIIDQGFDGVFLDVVDAFEFFGPAEEGGANERRDAARLMSDFMVEIAYHARVVRNRPDFLVVPQNGINIIEECWYPADTLGPQDPPTASAMAAATEQRLLSTVDGIATEDLFYSGPNDENNPYAPDTYLLGILPTWQGYGLTVLSTEYLTQSGKIDAFYDTHAPAAGVVPYASVRNLDQLTINSGHGPD